MSWTLPKGDVAALVRLQRVGKSFTCNFGTGRDHSVLEVADAYAWVSGQTLQCRMAGWREGDVDRCYADIALAREVFGW